MSEINGGLLSLSESAAKRIVFLAEQEGQEQAVLRVSVLGGGCSGFSYQFSFEEAKRDDDIVVERDGAAVVVDPMSLPFIAGSEVDYVEDLIGSFFSVKNPNATSSCGCGLSFSMG